MRVAAIDCGTNSTRLLIAESSDEPRGFTILDRRMRITRLGQGVNATKMLAPEAIERTAAVLREYRAAMDEFGVERVRITATSAARDAANREDFFSVAKEIVGVEPELLSGDEEARLSFRGATADLDPADGPFLIVDIGGGSTEFVVGTTEPEAALSVDIGCVRITEQELHHDPPLAEELSIALSLIDAYLDDVDREVPGASEAHVRRSRRDHHHRGRRRDRARRVRPRAHPPLPPDACGRRGRVSYAGHRVARRSSRQSRARPRTGRRDRGGCCILVAIFRHWGFDECLVSEADILDGLALSLLD